jgi:hypothetical protein
MENLWGGMTKEFRENIVADGGLELLFILRSCLVFSDSRSFLRSPIAMAFFKYISFRVSATWEPQFLKKSLQLILKMIALGEDT